MKMLVEDGAMGSRLAVLLPLAPTVMAQRPVECWSESIIEGQGGGSRMDRVEGREGVGSEKGFDAAGKVSSLRSIKEL